jgi:hypothetical protein
LENNNKIDIVEMNAIGAEEFKKLVWDTNWMNNQSKNKLYEKVTDFQETETHPKLL